MIVIIQLEELYLNQLTDVQITTFLVVEIFSWVEIVFPIIRYKHNEISLFMLLTYKLQWVLPYLQG